MKQKKFNIFLCILIAMAVIVTPVIASNKNLTLEQAKSIAQKYIPSGSTFIKSENDDNEYELKYYNEAKKEKYEVEINKLTQKISSYKSQMINDNGSNNVKLSEKDAEKVILNKFSDSSVSSVKLDTDDGFKVYEIKFNTKNYYGKAEVNPENGSILEIDIKVAAQSNNSSNNNTNLLSNDKIKEFAQKYVPGGIITDLDLDTKNKVPVFEIEMYKDGFEYDLEINAKTGEQISIKKEKDDWGKYNVSWDYKEYDFSDSFNQNKSSDVNTNSTKKEIGIEKAKEIALNKVPGAYIKKIELDTDDGRLIYEGEMYKDRMEYEFEIDAYTGEILKWETDYDD